MSSVDEQHVSLPQMQMPCSRRSFLKHAFWGIGLAATALITQSCGTDVIRTPGTAVQASTLRAVLYGTPAKVETFANLTQRFERAYPGRKVAWIPVQAVEWDEYFGKVITMIASGQSIDLVEVGTEGLQIFANKEIIQPLDPFVQADQSEICEYFSDVAPQLVKVMLHKGHLYMLPWLQGAAVIFYNKQLFAQAGLEPPADDWSVDDFLGSAQQISALGDDVFGFGWPNRHWGGIIPWIFVNDSNLLTEKHQSGGEWLWQTFYADNRIAQEAGGGFAWQHSRANDPRNVEALQFLQDLTWQHAVAPSPTDHGQLANFFSTNRLGMLPAHRFMVGRLISAGMQPGDFDVTFMPRWRSQRHQFGTSGMAILSDSYSPDLAWTLIKWMIRPDEMSEYVQGGVHTSARRSVTNDPIQHAHIGPENWHVFYDVFDTIPDTAPIPAPPIAKDMTNTLVKYVGLAMANELSPHDAMERMHTDLRARLRHLDV